MAKDIKGKNRVKTRGVVVEVVVVVVIVIVVVVPLT